MLDKYQFDASKIGNMSGHNMVLYVATIASQLNTRNKDKKASMPAVSDIFFSNWSVATRDKKETNPTAVANEWKSSEAIPTDSNATDMDCW